MAKNELITVGNTTGATQKKPSGGKRFFSAIASFFRKIGKSFKEVRSELKKVSWPSGSKVMKQTGVVLLVVLVFVVLICAADYLLAFLLELLVSAGA